MTRVQTPAEAKLRRMIETPIPRLVFTLSAPTIVSMLVSALYNMGGYLFCGPHAQPQRHGGSRRVLPAHGHFAGRRLYVRAWLGQLHLPRAGRAGE